MRSYDFLIVGAGIVGLTLGLELKKRYPKANVCVLEKEPQPGKHASGRNSGVLHSGIYYGRDTLKAQLCSKGGARMRVFAAEHGVSCLQSGKIIIATDEHDLPIIERLLVNAKTNNLRAVKMSESGIREIEPHARAHRFGLYCPDTAVIDSIGVVKKLWNLLREKGVTLMTGQEVTAVKPEQNIVYASGSGYRYGYFFNCAGAYADRIAKKFGLANDYILLPFKGIYFKLRQERSDLVKANIYPVPDVSLPFLGVHLTRVISGDVYAGPTAIPALGRENYGLLKGINVSESMGIAWELVEMYFKNHQGFRRLVHHELAKYIKTNFVRAARRLVPEITSADLIPTDKTGIRPQLVNLRSKKLEMDFIVEQTASSMHVLNAISPAFTSAFAFAEFLLDRYETDKAGPGPLPARTGFG